MATYTVDTTHYARAELTAHSICTGGRAASVGTRLFERIANVAVAAMNPIRRSRSAEPTTSRTPAHPAHSWPTMPPPTQTTPLAHTFELRVEQQDELSDSGTTPAPTTQTAHVSPYSALPVNPVVPQVTVQRPQAVTPPQEQQQQQQVSEASPSGSQLAETLGATSAPGYNTPPSEPPQRSTGMFRPVRNDFMEQRRAVQEFNNHNRTLRRQRARVQD